MGADNHRHRPRAPSAGTPALLRPSFDISQPFRPRREKNDLWPALCRLNGTLVAFFFFFFVFLKGKKKEKGKKKNRRGPSFSIRVDLVTWWRPSPLYLARAWTPFSQRYRVSTPSPSIHHPSDGQTMFPCGLSDPFADVSVCGQRRRHISTRLALRDSLGGKWEI